MDKELINNIDIFLMKDKLRKLKKLKEVLETQNKDSRKYLDDFYKKCKEGDIDDLNWVESDNEFSDFVSGVDIEYNRIYDIAILHLTEKLLTLLEE